MFLRKILFASVLSFGLCTISSRAADAGPSPFDNPQATPTVSINLSNSQPTVYGVSLVLDGAFSNLKGQKCQVVAKLVDKNGKALPSVAVHFLCQMTVTPVVDKHRLDPLTVVVHRGTIDQVYGDTPEKIYVLVTVVEPDSGKILVSPRIQEISLRIKPQIPIGLKDDPND